MACFWAPAAPQPRCILAGVFIILRNNKGEEVVRIPVAENLTATIEKDGKNVASVPGAADPRAPGVSPGIASTAIPPNTSPANPVARVPGSSPAGHKLEFDGQKSYVEVPKWEYAGGTPLTLEAWALPGEMPANGNAEVLNALES